MTGSASSPCHCCVMAVIREDGQGGGRLRDPTRRDTCCRQALEPHTCAAPRHDRQATSRLLFILHSAACAPEGRALCSWTCGRRALLHTTYSRHPRTPLSTYMYPNIFKSLPSSHGRHCHPLLPNAVRPLMGPLPLRSLLSAIFYCTLRSFLNFGPLTFSTYRPRLIVGGIQGSISSFPIPSTIALQSRLSLAASRRGQGWTRQPQAPTFTFHCAGSSVAPFALA